MRKKSKFVLLSLCDRLASSFAIVLMLILAGCRSRGQPAAAPRGGGKRPSDGPSQAH